MAATGQGWHGAGVWRGRGGKGDVVREKVQGSKRGKMGKLLIKYFL